MPSINILFKMLLVRRPSTPVRGKTNRGKTAGFTLIELLVSVILGSAIVAGLMSLVIELLTTDARETARTETQREMQMALDYISRDLREAVYVYDGACLAGTDVSGKALGSKCPGIFRTLKPKDDPDRSTPILAFWKLDSLPQGVTCPGSPSCLSGRSYTLVAYFLTDNDGDATWKGKARIQRWELPRYTSNGSEVSGYVNPLEVDGGFAQWPGSGSVAQLQNGATLVDFIDNRGLDDPDLKASLGDREISVDCPDEYVLTPHDTNVRNFYACIKVPDALKPPVTAGAAPATGAFNQKVILFIRGNAAGKPGIKDANEGFMPAIATQVLNRGVFDKTPQ
ncbi:MAG: prepilin-type N-terminal cleavage/methylation domain-containing protein [Geitlerinemataceae cyanobacterium]